MMFVIFKAWKTLWLWLQRRHWLRNVCADVIRVVAVDGCSTKLSEFRSRVPVVEEWAFACIEGVITTSFWWRLKLWNNNLGHVAAVREDGAVAAGWRQQGARVATRFSGRDPSGRVARNVPDCGVGSQSNGKLLTVPALQQALLAYLVSEAKKVEAVWCATGMKFYFC